MRFSKCFLGGAAFSPFFAVREEETNGEELNCGQHQRAENNLSTSAGSTFACFSAKHTQENVLEAMEDFVSL